MPSHQFHKITLERTPCYGDCPVYTLTIKDNGEVVMTERDYFEFEKGKRTWTISQEQIDKINFYLNKYGFFTIKKREATLWATDHPYCILEIETKEGVKRKIEHYLGDDEYPRRLTTIENWIDKLTEVGLYLTNT